MTIACYKSSRNGMEGSLENSLTSPAGTRPSGGRAESIGGRGGKTCETDGEGPVFKTEVEPPAPTDEDFETEASSLNGVGNSTPAGVPAVVRSSSQPIFFCGHIEPECLSRRHQHLCAKLQCAHPLGHIISDAQALARLIGVVRTCWETALAHSTLALACDLAGISRIANHKQLVSRRNMSWRGPRCILKCLEEVLLDLLVSCSVKIQTLISYSKTYYPNA